jgi:prepilin-type N-terminal cleavage/methylation domain-containing protein
MRGFSLVEVLVTTAISVIILTVVVSSIQAARAHARDNVRRATLQSIKLALEQYYAKNKMYPSTCTGVIPGSNPPVSYTADTPCTNIIYKNAEGTFNVDRLNQLVTRGFLAVLPDDPLKGTAVATKYRGPHEGVGAVLCRNDAVGATNVTYRYASTGHHYQLVVRCGSEGEMDANDPLVATKWFNQNSKHWFSITDIPAPPGTTIASCTNPVDYINKPYCW